MRIIPRRTITEILDINAKKNAYDLCSPYEHDIIINNTAVIYEGERACIHPKKMFRY